MRSQLINKQDNRARHKKLLLASVVTVSVSITGTFSIAEPSSSEQVSAYVDSYFSYNFNRPSPPRTPDADPDADADYLPYRGLANGGTRLRNFDVHHNQFSLALAELSYKRTVDDTMLKIDFDFGDIADMTHNTGGGTDEVTKNIGQAVISYSPKSLKNLNLNIGKMPTHVGYEVTKAKDNWQYSRSFLFAYAIPYWHSGINASYVIAPDLVSAGIYLYNGWNNMVDTNNGKTLGAQVVLTPAKSLTIIYNGIGGAEQEGNDKDKKIVHDVIITSALSDSIFLAMDFASGSETNAIDSNGDGTNEKAEWSALQVAVKYALLNDFYLSPRIEKYWDRDGYTTGTAQTLTEVTLTGSWKVSPQIETRLELRHDRSTVEAFVKNEEAVKTQSTITWGALVSL